MNKKLATVLAATCVLGATTAFAANPFSDVQPSDWAYQAVEQLADEGIIIGYPDGTFGGERNITRYEMAQMVARAMAHEDMANAEQQAQINRLANEFASELNSLGVRVTNLENRIGNVKMTGDARVRWADENKKDAFDMRARLNFNAKVAANTMVGARLSTGNFGFDSDKDATLTFDRLYVQHKVGDLALTGGRYTQKFGQTGYWYEDGLDGVKLAYKNGDFTAVAGYGKAKSMNLVASVKERRQHIVAEANVLADQVSAAYKAMKENTNDQTKAAYEAAAKAYEAKVKEVAVVGNETGAFTTGKQDVEMAYGILGYQGANFTLNGTYIAPNGSNVAAAKIDQIWGVGGALKADQFKLSGDFFRVEGKDTRKDADFWTARVDFGNLSKKQGTWGLFVDYVDADANAYFGGTSSLRTKAFLNDVKGWGAGAAFMIADNTKLEGLRTFNSESQSGVDKDERTVVQLVYKF